MVGKGELIFPLGESRAEAVRRYAHVHEGAERELTSARHRLARDRDEIIPGVETPRDHFFKARDQVAALGFDPAATPEAEWYERAIVAESIAARYPEDPQTGYPVGVRAQDTALVAALYGGSRKAPQPTMEDAKRIYLEDRFGRSNLSPKARKKDEQRAERSVGYIRTALGKNPQLVDLRRQDARAVQAHMLRVINSPGPRRWWPSPGSHRLR